MNRRSFIAMIAAAFTAPKSLNVITPAVPVLLSPGEAVLSREAVRRSAWTAPRTWKTGELVTAAQMNELVANNLLALGESPSFSIQDSISGDRGAANEALEQ